MPPPVDTRHAIETPEGIDLSLRPAGLVSRVLAFAIDLGVRGLILGILFMGLVYLGKLGLGLGAILLFLVNWWYMVLFEVLNQGRSPGKQLMGLAVVQDDGTPIGWSASLVRNLLRFVDMLPLGYFLGAISCLQHPTFKRLGDLAAGTLVIYLDPPPVRPQLPQVEPLAAPVALTLTEQRALMSFAERQGDLSPQRARELASIVAQALQVTPAEAPERINRIARGLLGPA
ncbi:MAG: RDD family protein [Pseudomonas sp.]|uniref:RDD family protein n=1 Tax=Pseudomonas abieticivorans TaxID=2931382 RepID=UPI0020BE7132|nr:RDD family protein [Pseudomonas sp. PIA16]MDE1163933.1 RDD family protein [Pseudomonas sp.]